MSKTGYRSRTSTQGRNMAGARSLWRATGMTDADFDKPIVAIANSFTQFVPGHVHLHDVGQRVKTVDRRRRRLGRRVQHHRRRRRHRDGPRRDALFAAEPRPHRRQRRVHGERPLRRRAGLHLELRQDHARHVDGRDAPQHPDHLRLGRPDGGRQDGRDARPRRQADRAQARPHRLDDRVVSDAKVSDAELGEMERSACPTCGSCSGMFTANSMNCLNEALGPGAAGQRHAAGHARPPLGAVRGGGPSGSSSSPSGTTSAATPACSRAPIATFEAFENAMTLDIAMGGSTNTVLHILAIAHEAGVKFTMADIDRLSRRVPNICKVAPSSHYHVEDVHRAGGIFTILGELDRAGLIHRDAKTVHGDEPGRRHRQQRHPPPERDRRGPPANAGRPRRRRDQGRLLAGQVLRRARRRRRRAAASATSRTPTARRAAWPSCTATSPRTAAS